MSKVTINTIVPNYQAFTKDLDEAIAAARTKADQSDCPQAVFEGPAYGWYGFMSNSDWIVQGESEDLCRVQIVKPRELEALKRNEIAERLKNLSLDQLQKIESFIVALGINPD